MTSLSVTAGSCFDLDCRSLLLSLSEIGIRVKPLYQGGAKDENMTLYL